MADEGNWRRQAKVKQTLKQKGQDKNYNEEAKRTTKRKAMRIGTKQSAARWALSRPKDLMPYYQRAEYGFAHNLFYRPTAGRQAQVGIKWLPERVGRAWGQNSSGYHPA